MNHLRTSEIDSIKRNISRRVQNILTHMEMICFIIFESYTVILVLKCFYSPKDEPHLPESVMGQQLGARSTDQDGTGQDDPESPQDQADEDQEMICE